MTSISLASPLLMWPNRLVCEYIDGTNWRLEQPFEFHSPTPEFPSVTLPPGFITDFASVPRLFWNELYPTHPHIAKMAVVHDLYYRTPTIDITRERADHALRSGMEALGAPWWKRQIVYRAVRINGGHAFQPRAIHAAA